MLFIAFTLEKKAKNKIKFSITTTTARSILKIAILIGFMLGECAPNELWMWKKLSNHLTFFFVFFFARREKMKNKNSIDSRELTQFRSFYLFIVLFIFSIAFLLFFLEFRWGSQVNNNRLAAFPAYSCAQFLEHISITWLFRNRIIENSKTWREKKKKNIKIHTTQITNYVSNGLLYDFRWPNRTIRKFAQSINQWTEISIIDF